MRIYRWMRTARCIDELEHELVARGEAFFQVSSAGHEATAALAPLLIPDDYLHCHYRDKALLIGRGVPIIEFFDSLLCTGVSHSAGRQMSAHLSAPALNVLSIVGPVGNHALQAVGVAQEIKARPARPIVLCALGDGATQQGEVLEAIAEAVRRKLPVLFLIEDNHYSISTRTRGKTFYSLPDADASSFYGLPLNRVDGSDAGACRQAFGMLVREMRATRGPAVCVMQVERLADHTNADDEKVYRDAEEIGRVRATADPIARLRTSLTAGGVDAHEIARVDAVIEAEVRAAADAALTHAAPWATEIALPPVPAELADRHREYRGGEGAIEYVMGAALRESLLARMRFDLRVSLYGQDIEDPKGDVFGVTRGLTLAFPGRVANAPLSESTIVGTSIGRALAGARPVAFLQFADFFPLAFNQIASELSSIGWRTNGGWSAPLIVLAPCGGYRPGLGPFHAGSYESIAAHLPGIDVAVPSTAADAAGMLNAAFRGERPTLMFYPKALLNDPQRGSAGEVARLFVPIGTARTVRTGADLTLVGWGNTVPICELVAATLASAGVETDVIDLRWLAPWDRQLVCASARKTGRLLVVHEDNRTGGFGAEVIATVTETLERPVRCRRVARADTHIPCHFGNQLAILPSYRSTLTAAAELCGLDLHWESPPQIAAGRQVVTVIGSSPADQTVEVVALLVKVGDRVKAGETLASLEADKAVVDLASPDDGTVEEIHLGVGDRAPVDAPLLTLRVAHSRQRQPTREQIDVVRLSHAARATPRATAAPTAQTVVLTGLAVVRGRDTLANTELAHRFPHFAAASPGGDGI
jgi:2-oxoisovalerate dehydrogenase E1 component